MPYPHARRSARRAAGEDRVFADSTGRLWSATFVRGADGAVLFTCITESRHASRAIAADVAFGRPGRGVEPRGTLAGVADDTLRAWLAQAPRVAQLI